MKKLFIASMLAIGFLSAFGVAQADPARKEVSLAVGDAYIPGGFDSNSDAYVVETGYYPNGCYTWGRSQITNSDTFTHQIQTFANVKPGLCPMIILPFTKEVQLGKLATGTHKIQFMNGDGTYMEKSLTIE